MTRLVKAAFFIAKCVKTQTFLNAPRITEATLSREQIRERFFNTDTYRKGSQMHSHTNMSDAMKACIDNCTRCHQVCLQTVLTHCIEVGGDHATPDHVRLMLNCAEICQASANLQLSGSAFSAKLCGVCSEICEACALSCEAKDEMADCVQACQQCAQSCKAMATMSH